MKSVLSVATLLMASFAFGATAHTVGQKGLKFSAASLNVAKGETVVFRNDDRTSHNITVNGAELAINGGLQEPGGEFRMPFTKAGTFQVTCGIHPKMKMSVVVE